MENVVVKCGLLCEMVFQLITFAHGVCCLVGGCRANNRFSLNVLESPSLRVCTKRSRIYATFGSLLKAHLNE